MPPKKSPVKTAKKAKKEGPKKTNPYMLFSSATRPDVKASNPDATFGEIAKLVGAEWKKLSEKDQKVWSDKAAAANAKAAKEFKGK